MIKLGQGKTFTSHLRLSKYLASNCVPSMTPRTGELPGNKNTYSGPIHFFFLARVGKSSEEAHGKKNDMIPASDRCWERRVVDWIVTWH